MTTPALPEGYAEVLAELKERVRSSRHRAVRKVNTELLELYWDIGRTILARQTLGGWGAKVIDRLAKDLRAEFPGMTGLSRSNLHYMRSFAEAWPNGVVPQPVGQLGWGHVRTLLDKLDDQPTRDWYAAAAAEEGWSRNVLLNMIMGQLHRRISAAPSNFDDALPATQTDLARELTKDPYIFDFLAQTRPRLERDLEQALVERMQETLTEFGSGFAFVGRQVHFEVDGDDFYVDLLFFHVTQLRYVVIELKSGRFTPRDAGQLGFYVALVDDRLRAADTHAETVGILLCADKHDGVVEYALKTIDQPVAIARYTYDTLPDDVRDLLPPPNEVLDAIEPHDQT
ncbi:PDDEXK nuclease domain-containing protein [Nocardioides albus]|uniref:Putative nuclease of restriction endonuclease-like (RecB) superfamily n=1 Tax=Nocardioides albus TaxID=1841 RepID=A0A7W5FBF9_9ACTN|nr:PDDEXK nuclease domain-containing protein [Nocardioides albus]MBB3092170.1 putative nuclease of restriction endonuclease-like (RecB) superfamily [Nocardioides albus]GGU46128.1 hypothetical protein GCM10007979_51570 [Nocardioides albus]